VISEFELGNLGLPLSPQLEPMKPALAKLASTSPPAKARAAP
jgi:hypothetical protein